jgi:outer membrane biosynthesis protein TonB
MSFIKSTALRASSFARAAARPSRFVRTAELQPWRQAVQRRTYASGHGAHGEAKTSDAPWLATAVVSTAVGLYIVVNQDTGSHGEHGDHDDHHAKHEEAPAEEESKVEPEEESKEEPKEDKSQPKKDTPEEDSTHSQSAEVKAEGKKAEKKAQKAEASSEKIDDESGEESPDKSDKPHPRKEAKSFNETSGKQQGLSNDDTHHTYDISHNPEKSKKGEGVAETAKLKGTVSTDRPGAENKEERGKESMDKDA